MEDIEYGCRSQGEREADKAQDTTPPCASTAVVEAPKRHEKERERESRERDHKDER